MCFLRILLVFSLLFPAGIQAQSLYGLAAAWCSTTVCVSWMAVCGSGSRYFVVERSTDGVTYDTAGYVGVPPSCPREYSFNDSAAWSNQRGTAFYYRIRKISDDQPEELSGVTTLPLDLPPDLRLQMANPYDGTAVYVFSSRFGAATLALISVAGQELILPLEIQTGANPLAAPFAGLSPGIWQVRLTVGEATLSTSVVIPR